MRPILVIALDPVLAHRVLCDGDRTQSVDEVATGHGIAIASSLRRLGEAVDVVILGAGVRAERLGAVLAADGIGCRFVPAGERPVLAGVILHDPGLGAVAGSYRELVPPPLPVQIEDGHEVGAACVRSLEQASAVVVAASPQQVIHGDSWLRGLQEAASRAGVPLAVDASASLAAALDPEVGVYLRCSGLESLGHAPELAAISEGRGVVVATSGPDPVRVLSADARFAIQPPVVGRCDRSGCGAAFVAGWAAGLAEGRELAMAVRFGVATAAADAGRWLPGSFDRLGVEGFLPQVGPAIPL